MAEQETEQAVLDNEGAMSIFDHLKELRDRLVKSLIVVFAVFLVMVFLREQLFLLLTSELTAKLLDANPDNGLISTQVAGAFLMPLKLAFFVSVFIAIPFVLHQVWGFVAPALYNKEKRFALPLFISSVLLFYLGLVFTRYVIMPLAFGFFAGINLINTSINPDISHVLDFSLKLFFVFGIAFEIPIAIILLVKAGLVKVKKLQQKRGFVFIGCFFVGMLVTPPDIYSQTLLAIPMWLLFEAGLIASKLMFKDQDQDEDDDDADDDIEDADIIK